MQCTTAQGKITIITVLMKKMMIITTSIIVRNLASMQNGYEQQACSLLVSDEPRRCDDKIMVSHVCELHEAGV